MKNTNMFYTYAYLREDGTPYYIGKGVKDRIYSSNRKIKKPEETYADLKGDLVNLDIGLVPEKLLGKYAGSYRIR